MPVLYGAGGHAATVAELEASLESARQVEQTVQPGALRDVPVVVISAANSRTTDRAHHAALAALSSRGQHIVADSGGHYVHYDDPDLVIEAVRGILSGSAGGQ